MKRAADSVVFNIAESAGKDGLRDQIRILMIARGSAYELESQFYSVSDREASLTDQCEQLRLDACEVQRMINGLIKHKRGRLDGE
jgi:four helix bundle protein